MFNDITLDISQETEDRRKTNTKRRASHLQEFTDENSHNLRIRIRVSNQRNRRTGLMERGRCLRCWAIWGQQVDLRQGETEDRCRRQVRQRGADNIHGQGNGIQWRSCLFRGQGQCQTGRGLPAKGEFLNPGNHAPGRTWKDRYSCPLTV